MTEPAQIRRIDIDSEMQQSYLDYAMSVIVSRALPDARDGLKPVQRRILYAMYDLGLGANASYKKSARIVGEVLGKYHPHGDMAVYDAMARLAQDFSMRCLLVDGQGNFGSVDGDPPAAMRYTEARLTAAALEMLAQIDKNTVEFAPNFDGTLKEPVVLPGAIPNLLVNGATGIAVGMATNIPPHNLNEVVDALIFLLRNWNKLDDISVDQLMNFIKGPDFPTGGVIIQDQTGEGLASVYGSGKGRVIIQARAHMEEMERGKNRIIVTELPYMVNKASLIERIADLVREGNLEGVVDLRDESDRHGLRVVIEISKNVDPEVVLRNLYKRTTMQSTFGITLLALVGGEPRLLSLKQALRVFLDHRLVVIQRKSEYELEKARQRAHILEGLRIAIKYLDEIIALIRNSNDADEARVKMMKKYHLTEVQAQAVLDMPLKRLAALERKKLEEEYREVTLLIKMLEDLLNSPEKIRLKCIEELDDLKKKYGEKRKTQIIGMKEGANLSAMLTVTDMMDSEDVWIGINESGLAARTGGKVMPWTSGRDAAQWLVRCDTHHTLYLVTENGRCASIPVHSVPESNSLSEGTPVHKISSLSPEDNLAAAFSLPSRNTIPDSLYILTVTRGGMIKKSAAADLPGPSAQVFNLCKVNEGDTLGWVWNTNGERDILLATGRGACIRFKEEEVRPMGLIAVGVGGIKLAIGDMVIGSGILGKEGSVILFTTDGRAKRVAASDFPVQGRNGMGVSGWKLNADKSVVAVGVGTSDDRYIIQCLKSSAKVKKWDEIPSGTRVGQGKVVVELKPGDEVLGISTFYNGFLVNDLKKGASKNQTIPDSQDQLELFPDQKKLKRTTSKKSSPGVTQKSGNSRKKISKTKKTSATLPGDKRKKRSTN